MKLYEECHLHYDYYCTINCIVLVAASIVTCFNVGVEQIQIGLEFHWEIDIFCGGGKTSGYRYEDIAVLMWGRYESWPLLDEDVVCVASVGGWMYTRWCSVSWHLPWHPSTAYTYRALCADAMAVRLLHWSLAGMNEWCFRPRFCTVRLYWARDSMGSHWYGLDKMLSSLLWIN